MHSSDDISLDNRLAFAGIDARVIATLRENSAFIMAEMPGILASFYDHVSRNSAASAFFRDRAHMNHAAQKQVEHWRIIAHGRFDASYAASVNRIGLTHYKLGLEPELYVGGYSFLLSRMVVAVNAKFTSSWGKSQDPGKLQAALIKAALLDMDLAISVYIAHERNERKKAMDNLMTLASSVSEIAGGVSAAALQLETTARGMAAGVQSTSRETKLALSSTSEVSANMGTVASATQQLTGSVGEIGGQVQRSARAAQQACENANRTNDRVRLLSQAAEKIGNVVTLITTIARQTNLLALNATIEAARAGEAGRGFAVVAQEVKTLADRTALATSDIAAQVGAIQESTQQAGSDIHAIAETIRDISTVSCSIAAAVDEQGAACQEIARNAHDVSIKMSQLTENMKAVDRDAESSSDGASQVLTVASNLAREAERLRNEVVKIASRSDKGRSAAA